MPQQTEVPILRKTRRGRWEADERAELAPILVSKKEAASALSLCVRTIDNLIARKELPCRRIGRRTLIPYSALVAFARRDHVGVPGSVSQ